MSEGTPTLEGYTDEQRKEWGKYVCGSDPIDIGGARAFNPGDPVPASHVDREDAPVRRDQVVGVNTKTAKSLTNPEG